MPGYINENLHKYQHPAPTRPEHAPHQWNPPVYRAKTQYVEDTQDSPALSPKDVTRLQQLVGILPYYARAVDPMLIMQVNDYSIIVLRTQKPLYVTMHQT
jgi:hypothetical protein